jgi:hypothetical protein
MDSSMTLLSAHIQFLVCSFRCRVLHAWYANKVCVSCMGSLVLGLCARLPEGLLLYFVSHTEPSA